MCLECPKVPPAPHWALSGRTAPPELGAPPRATQSQPCPPREAGAASSGARARGCVLATCWLCSRARTSKEDATKRPIGSRVGKMTLRRGLPAAGSGGGCGGCPGISFSARRSPHLRVERLGLGLGLGCRAGDVWPSLAAACSSCGSFLASARSRAAPRRAWTMDGRPQPAVPQRGLAPRRRGAPKSALSDALLPHVAEEKGRERGARHLPHLTELDAVAVGDQAGPRRVAVRQDHAKVRVHRADLRPARAAGGGLRPLGGLVRVE